MRPVALATIASLATCAYALQGAGAQDQKPLDAEHPLHPHAPPSPPVDISKKRLIDSEELQDLIKVDNLYSRAEKLYKIAQKSEDEFNHPTRVIGSKGAYFSFISNVKVALIPSRPQGDTQLH